MPLLLLVPVPLRDSSSLDFERRPSHVRDTHASRTAPFAASREGSMRPSDAMRAVTDASMPRSSAAEGATETTQNNAQVDELRRFIGTKETRASKVLLNIAEVNSKTLDALKLQRLIGAKETRAPKVLLKSLILGIWTCGMISYHEIGDYVRPSDDMRAVTDASMPRSSAAAGATVQERREMWQHEKQVGQGGHLSCTITKDTVHLFCFIFGHTRCRKNPVRDFLRGFDTSIEVLVVMRRAT